MNPASPHERADRRSPHRRCRTPFRVVVLAAVALSLLAGQALAQSDEAAAARAAREIADARDRANSAAQEWSLSERELERLDGEAAQLVMEQTDLQREVDALRKVAEAAAVERYVSSGRIGIPVLTGYQAPLAQMQSAQLTRTATSSTLDAFDQFDFARSSLDDKAAEVAATQAAQETQRTRSQELYENAIAEIARLQEIETKRLEDEQVRLALEAQQREERRRLAEQQAAEAARREAEEQQRAAAQAAAAAEENNRLAALQAAAQEAARSAPASGGRIGAVPAPVGDQPRDAAEEVDSAPADPEMVCPVAGATAYGDTWGAGRSGGRSHEGVDMISAGGTPLVAVTNGEAEFRQNALGGNTVSLTGDSGDRYYYAHLRGYEGSSRSVLAGEVIGYVGLTGNTDVNHLHFQVFPGNGAPVNPTPYVRNAGC